MHCERVIILKAQRCLYFAFFFEIFFVKILVQVRCTKCSTGKNKINFFRHTIHHYRALEILRHLSYISIHTIMTHDFLN